MGLESFIGNFVEGLKSVIFQAGTLNKILSDAIANGVENGIARAMPLLLKTIAISSILFTGIFLLGWGFANFVEQAIKTPGFGFIVVGAILVGITFLYLKMDRR